MLTTNTYDSEALDAIAQFKNPDQGWLDTIFSAADRPIDAADEALADSLLGTWLSMGVSSVLSTLSDASRRTVRQEQILADISTEARPIERLEDLAALPLEALDDALGRLDLKYKALGFVEGTVAGAFGPMASVTSHLTLIGLSLRAIHETATHYGFDCDDDSERIYAMAVLGVSGAITDAQRREMIAWATSMGQRIARGERVEACDALIAQNIRGLAELLVLRVASGGLSRAVPLVGSVIGGGISRTFLAAVCKAAHRLYQERALMRTHGPEVAIDAEEATAVDAQAAIDAEEVST